MNESQGASTSAAAAVQEARWWSSLHHPIGDVVSRVVQGHACAMQGVQGSWLGLVLWQLEAALSRPLVLVVPRPEQARGLVDALNTLAPPGAHAVLVAPPDVSPWGDVTPDRNVVTERLLALSRLRSLGRGQILVASGVAWARRVLPKVLVDAGSRVIRLGDRIDPRDLRTLLVGAGYQSAAVVEDPGTFSMRGDRADIWSPAHAEPVRLQIYGDELDGLRFFDPQSQRGTRDCAALEIIPVREEILVPQTLAHARERLGELGSRLRVPSRQVSAVLQDLTEGNRFFGMERFLPALAPALEPLHAWLHGDALVLVQDPAGVCAEVDRWHQQRRKEYERVVADGGLVFAPEDFLLTADEVESSWTARGAWIQAGGVVVDPTLPTMVFAAEDNAELVRRRKGLGGGEAAVRELLQEIASWRPRYGRVVVSCGSRGTAERVHRLLEDAMLASRMVPQWRPVEGPTPPPCGSIEVTVGDLREGFRSAALGLAVVTDMELLGRTGKRQSRDLAVEATAVAHFRDLQPGDLVVHIDHGIARYGGLVRLDAGGYETDFLALEFADANRLYLPVHRLGKVQKYVGSTVGMRLDRLGGTAWEKTRERVRRQLTDIAHELVRLYAERQTRRGHAFSAPDDLYRNFEADFPFEETPGQAQAIEETLGDMMSERPMDRLVCGDVGFGKTEVAIRAAFKAVVDGRQVAVLVPTTVLAEQHHKSFSRRLEHTAARVACISRFRTPQEIREILQQAAAGRIDVLVGTHRLLSDDVKFRDLGLLVIDEEQRFGVQHKEKLKQFRAEVDVLTMTATPIPRTLEMSLLGIRDLSMITTPPPGRQAVRTHVAKFSPAVVREAVLAEMERGGQVFFVHNRVETIHAVADTVREMVPEARVLVGHAQMRDTELEDVMMRFLDRQADVLVSTTIVESGIDISTANTIFIHDAHQFGLAQLHQLRGRVGRGGDRAYCYLLVSDPRKLSPEAQRRLEVIQTHTELGSGMQIAQQDLDIRGAGNLLGRDQSGHIESIGFELYMELLQEAVQEIQGEAIEERWEPEVKVPVPAFLPETYVEDVGQRLAFYKRFNLADSDAGLFDLHAELEERYGPAPAPVTGLRDIVSLKIALRTMGIQKLDAGPSMILLDLRSDTRLAPDRVMELIRGGRGTWEFRPDMKLVRHLKVKGGTDTLTAALQTVRDLLPCLTSPTA
jgi:transcription-repair coupling factor (superfamily II helicase)